MSRFASLQEPEIRAVCSEISPLFLHNKGNHLQLDGSHSKS
ncbi:hypothetical protein [Lysinibacillus sp. CTST325]